VLSDISRDMIDANLSYILVLFQTDGHRRIHIRSPNSLGDLGIELSIKDVDILEKLQPILGPKATISKRTRITNFSAGKIYQTASLRIGARFFPEEILKYIPIGKKSLIISPPQEEYSEADYWRGIMDGDGSLGLRKSRKDINPFCSLTTASEDIYVGYTSYIANTIGLHIECKRNKRDNIYNICVGYNYCQPLIAKLYYNGCLALDRKLSEASKIRNWIRPPLSKVYYTAAEDEIIKNNSLEEASVILNRSIDGVKVRSKTLQKLF